MSVIEPPFELSTIYAAVATTGTAVYKSLVLNRRQQVELLEFAVSKTGTGTGVLSLEINNKNSTEYGADVTSAGSEAANTAGWVQMDLSPTATIAISAANPETHTIGIESAARRFRLSFANVSGTCSVSAYASMG